MVKISKKMPEIIPRPINPRPYALALIITILIFSAGMYIGTQIDGLLFNDIRQDISSAEDRITATELLLQIGDSAEFCSFFEKQMDSFGNDTYKLGSKLGFLENEKGTIDNEVKSEYFLLELRDYLLMKKFSTTCSTDAVPVLYFLSNSDCPGCMEQGNQLTDARIASGERLKVYSFDVGFESPAVEWLVEK